MSLSNVWLLGLKYMFIFIGFEESSQKVIITKKCKVYVSLLGTTHCTVTGQPHIR